MERKYIKCKTCNDWHWSDRECNPIFQVEYEEEIYDVYAVDFEEASEKFAEGYNERHEYDLINSEIEIKVTDSKGVEKTFKVGAEQSVSYWSKEV